MWRTPFAGGALFVVGLVSSSCTNGAPVAPAAVASAGLQARADGSALPAASEFVTNVDNRFFPLSRGSVLVSRAKTPAGVEVTRVTVTSDSKVILGIAATVVHDEVFLNGTLIEDTFDWFAQDKVGNVWYLGERSCEIQASQCVSTAGSWEAGVGGAQAGIVMWANPSAHVGKTYRQEFAEGEAEDMAKIVKLDARVDVPFGTFSGCVMTVEWTPLDPSTKENKFYCEGLGLVLETGRPADRVRNELVEVLLP